MTGIGAALDLRFGKDTLQFLDFMYFTDLNISRFRVNGGGIPGEFTGEWFLICYLERS